MSIEAPASNPASDLSLKLPSTVGAAGQVLKNGSTAGTLEFGSTHFFEVKISANVSYNGAFSAGLATLVPYNTENYDIGSNFNTSTHLYTVPETGLYQFFASIVLNGDNFASQGWLVVNGSRASFTDWVQSTGDDFLNTAHLLYLTAGDTVGYHLYTATNGATTILESNNHTWFKGYKCN